MISNSLTIALACALPLLAIISSLIANPFVRGTGKRNKKDEDTTNESLPRVTVVVLSKGTSEQIEAHLPAILAQKYEPGFDVVVVASKGDSATDDVLKRLSAAPNLYKTFVPSESLFMSRGKLAVTIGVKASQNEWILLTDSRCCPASENWISTMVAHCHEADTIQGYVGYDEEAKPFYRFTRLREQLYILRRAARKKAVAATGANIMFRKSKFIAGDGFRGNLQYTLGEYDFIANKYSEQGHTAIETSPEARITEDAPTPFEWRGYRKGAISYRNHLAGIGSLRFIHWFDTLLLWLNYALIIGIGVAAGLLHQWIILGAASAALVLTIVLRTILGARAMKRYGAGVSAWSIVVYELRSLFATFGTRLAYMRADKNEFTSHKL